MGVSLVLKFPLCSQEKWTPKSQAEIDVLKVSALMPLLRFLMDHSPFRSVDNAYEV
jgi:hypothetical protein